MSDRLAEEHLQELSLKYQSMAKITMTRDPVLRSLRWVMAAVIAVDTTVTIIGQPGGFWKGTGEANEGNDLIRIFVEMGPLKFLVSSFLYIMAAFLLVSYLPRRLALAILFAYMLGHYFGASTWLVYSFRFGMTGAVTYAAILAMLISWLGFPGKSDHKM